MTSTTGTQSVELSTGGAIAVTRLEAARAALRDATEAEKAAKGAVLAALNGATVGTVEGVTVVEVVEVHVPRLDSKTLGREMPDVAAKYTKDTSYEKVVIV